MLSVKDAVPDVLPRETFSGPTGSDGFPRGSRVKYSDDGKAEWVNQKDRLARGTSIGWIVTVLFMVVLIVYDYASDKMKFVTLLLFAS